MPVDAGYLRHLIEIAIQPSKAGTKPAIYFPRSLSWSAIRLRACTSGPAEIRTVGD
jgi:hypothetical protein